MSDEVLVALITGFFSILTNALTLIGMVYLNRNVTKTHNAVNSKMSELLALTATSARAEGRLEPKL